VSALALVEKVKGLTSYFDVSQTETKLKEVISDSERLDRILFAYTIFCCVYLFLFPSYPTDDILRHSVSYRLGYDLRSLYYESYWPSFNPYMLFDMIAGLFNEWFGIYGISVIQSIILALTVIALRKLGRDIFTPATFLLYLAICLYISDYLSARPKAVVNALFLLSLAYPLISPLLMLIAVPIYSAFWLYIPPLLVYHFSRERKTIVLLLCAVLCFGLIFWLINGGGDYIVFISNLINVRKLRSAGLDVTENISIIRGMAVYLFLFYPYFFHAMKEKRAFLSGLYFMAVNQVRFLPSLTPIALRFFRYESAIRLPYMFVILFLFMIPNLKSVPFPETAQAVIKSVEKAFEGVDMRGRILAVPLVNFALTYLYAGKRDLQIAPPPEVGFLNQELQENIKKPDCEVLQRYNIRYYVASPLSRIDESNLDCLELLRVSNKFSLYRVAGGRNGAKKSINIMDYSPSIL
jgi:hypothetical protein